MFAAIVTLCISPTASLDGVTLADAYAFGVRPEAVRPLWILSSKHAGVMRDQVRVHNQSDVADHWERECLWREQCWFLLDDVVGCPHYTLETKLKSLAKLRRLLGDDDYYAGRMPDPTPKYRPWSD